MKRGPYTADDDAEFYSRLGEMTTRQLDTTFQAFREAQAIERQFREEEEYLDE